MPATGRRLGWVLALALLAAVLLWALAVGQFSIAPQQLWQSLLARATGTASPLSASAETVLWNIRLPRIAAGLAVGATVPTRELREHLKAKCAEFVATLDKTHPLGKEQMEQVARDFAFTTLRATLPMNWVISNWLWPGCLMGAEHCQKFNPRPKATSMSWLVSQSSLSFRADCCKWVCSVELLGKAD